MTLSYKIFFLQKCKTYFLQRISYNYTIFTLNQHDFEKLNERKAFFFCLTQSDSTYMNILYPQSYNMH